MNQRKAPSVLGVHHINPVIHGADAAAMRRVPLAKTLGRYDLLAPATGRIRRGLAAARTLAFGNGIEVEATVR